MPTVTPETPWLGLRSFTEQVGNYFFGRDREIRELTDRIQHRPLTVLFGQSGLGKTSLVQAGVIPQLRAAGYRPVLVRLIHDPAILDLPLEQQVLQEIARSFEIAGAEPATNASSLWHLFHDLRFGFVGAKDVELLRPVLIFDQFEEIFTLGETKRRTDATAFLESLACLVENRPPQDILHRLETDDDLADRLRQSARPCQVVLSMRNDFLPQLERHRRRMPSMMENRLELRRLSGPQAFEAVFRPGQRRTSESGRPPILDQPTAESIVRLVAGKEADVPLSEIDNVPPLLSLICEQLNARRLRQAKDTLEITDVQGSADEVLRDFVSHCFQAYPPAVRQFVEERLISSSGFRESVNLDSAVAELANAGITNAEQTLRSLVNERLLTIEDRGGVARIELTHDILAPVIVRLRSAGTSEQALQQAYLIYDSLGDATSRERLQLMAQRLFRSLSDRDPDGQIISRAITIGQAADEIGANEADVLLVARAFVDGGVLLVLERTSEITAQTTLQVVHRSLFRQWNLLQTWLDEEADAAAGYRRLVDAIQANVKRLDDVSLDLAITWRGKTNPQPAWARRYERHLESATSVLPKCLQLIESSLAAQVEDKRAREDARREREERQLRDLAFAKKLTDSESARAESERKKSAVIRRWLVAVACLAVASVILAFYAWKNEVAAEIATAAAVESKVEADKNAKEASDSAELVKKEKDRSEILLERSERLLYASQIRAAEREYTVGNTQIARQNLDACRWDYRGWEHDNSNSDDFVLRGHSDSVNSVSFSPDGSRIVSGSSDNSIKLWDAATGAELRTLTGHSDSVLSVSFSPDGSRIVSGSSDKTIKLWDAATGAELRTLTGHSDSVNSVSFSPDGARIVSASNDNTIKVWDAATGAELRTLTGHSENVWSVSFSPDEARIVSGSLDGTIKVWDAATGVALRTFSGHSQAVNSVSFSPDGQRIVSGSFDETIKLWDATTGAELRTLTGHSDTVWSVSFSPDGQRIVSGSFDNTIKLWDATTGAELRTLTGHSDAVLSVSFSPDGQWIVSGSDDKTIKLWDAAKRAELHNLAGHSLAVTSVSFSRDGQRIVSGSHDKTIKLWDAVTGAEQRTLIGHSGTVMSVSFSPDGQRIVSGSHDETIKLWDAATGEELRTLTGHSSYVNLVSFSPDGQRIVSGSFDNTIKLWDATTGAELRTLTGHSDAVLSVSFSPDGQRIVSGSFDKTIKLWDAATGTELRTLTGHSAYVSSVSFSPDGSRIVSGSDDKTIKLWDAATGAELRTLTGHSEGVQSVSFSRDGQRIVSGSVDNTISLWGAPRRRAMLPAFVVNGVSSRFVISGDQKWIAASDNQGVVRLINAESGRVELELTANKQPITSLAVRPNLSQVVAGDSDNSIIVWNLNAGEKRPALLRQKTIKSTHGEQPWCMAYCDDQSLLAVGMREGIVRILDAESMKEKTWFNAHDSYVKGLQFDQGRDRLITIGWTKGDPEHQNSEIKVWDWESKSRKLVRTVATPEGRWTAGLARHGRLIASGSESGQLKVWDFETGREVFSLEHAHQSDIHGIAFSPDGSLLATAGNDMLGRIWTVDSSDPDHVVVKLAIELPEHYAELTSIAFSHGGTRAVSSGKDGYVRVWLLEELMPWHFKGQPAPGSGSAIAVAVVESEPEAHLTPEPSSAFEPAAKDASSSHPSPSPQRSLPVFTPIGSMFAGVAVFCLAIVLATCFRRRNSSN